MKYSIGQKASFTKTISESDVYSFAGITGDFNQVHVNKVLAEKSIFGERVAHGCLVSSFISTVLGMYLPGPGTIYLKQEIEFKRPVFINNTITAQVEICQIDGKYATLKTIVTNEKEEICVSGQAIVKLPG